MEAKQGTPFHYIGVSLPRSGHSFFRRALIRYFRHGLKFCDAYKPERCCQARPCTALGGAQVFYQKNHDFDLGLDPTMASESLAYVVQYRHPIPQLLSYLEHSGVDPGSPARFAWMAQHLRYRAAFVRKWLRPAPPGVLRLRYEDLVANPQRAIGGIIRHGVGRVNERRLAAAIGATAGKIAGGDAFEPRVLEASAHFDRASLAAYEALLLEEEPDLGYAPMFGGGTPDAAHPMVRAYRTQARAHAMPEQSPACE